MPHPSHNLDIMEWTEIDPIITTQLGLVTGNQLAAAAGDSITNGSQVAARHRFTRVRRNVYRAPGVPEHPDHLLLAPCLEVGPPVAVAERSALARWGLRPTVPPRVHLLVPHDRRPEPAGVIVHRTRHWRRDDVTHLGPLPIVTPARAIVDTTGSVDFRELERMLDEGRRLGIITVEQVREVREAFKPGRGRRVRMVDRALGVRRLDLPPGDSRGEQWVLDVLTAAGYEPVHHHVVRLQGRTFELDVALFPWRIDIEFDGFHAHTGAVPFFEDPERDRLLRRHGWYVTRVTARTTAGALLDEVAAAIADQTAAS